VPVDPAFQDGPDEQDIECLRNEHIDGLQREREVDVASAVERQVGLTVECERPSEEAGLMAESAGVQREVQLEGHGHGDEEGQEQQRRPVVPGQRHPTSRACALHEVHLHHQ